MPVQSSGFQCNERPNYAVYRRKNDNFRPDRSVRSPVCQSTNTILPGLL